MANYIKIVHFNCEEGWAHREPIACRHQNSDRYHRTAAVAATEVAAQGSGASFGGEQICDDGLWERFVSMANWRIGSLLVRRGRGR